MRYPGGKTKLYSYVKNLLETQNKIGCTFYEPFAGSAALSIMLLESNIIKEAIINEKDPLIYYFWICVFNYTEELISLIEQTEINIENWYKYAEYRKDNVIENKSIVEIGYAGLFLNRTNFSGILKANPLGGKQQTSNYKIDCRFNKKSIIQCIRRLSLLKERIRVYNLDALEFMKKHLRYKHSKKIFVYIDPPYYKEGPGLYRYYYTHQQHYELAKYIKSKSFPWLISYDNVDEIKNMYITNIYINIYLDYSIKTSRKEIELLISNLEIPPIEEENEVLIG
nr:DNA adenine methylase [Holtiella tumoricola]